MKTKSLFGGRVEVIGPAEYVDAAASHIETTITKRAGAVRPLPAKLLESLPEWPTEAGSNCEPCPNCGRQWFADQLRSIRDPFQRIAPGEPMPAGECPECGALCHLAGKPDDGKLLIAAKAAARYIGYGHGDQIEVWDRLNSAIGERRNKLDKPVASKPLRVVVEVLGGVAEVTTCPAGVEVEIIDHDNAKRG